MPEFAAGCLAPTAEDRPNMNNMIWGEKLNSIKLHTMGAFEEKQKNKVFVIPDLFWPDAQVEVETGL